MFTHGRLTVAPGATRNKSYDPMATIVNGYGIKIDSFGIKPEENTPNVDALTNQDVGQKRPLTGMARQIATKGTKMKTNLAIVSLCALMTNVSSGALSEMPAERSNANLRGDYPRDVRVWPEQREPKADPRNNKVVLKGYDVVAYFAQNKAIQGTSKFQTNYKGATYYFASAADLSTFKQQPAKYVPQYGGYCAYHLAHKELVPGDPNVFFFIDGKLYVCSSPDGEKKFRAKEQENMKNANQNWQGQWWTRGNES